MVGRASPGFKASSLEPKEQAHLSGGEEDQCREGKGSMALKPDYSPQLAAKLHSKTCCGDLHQTHTPILHLSAYSSLDHWSLKQPCSESQITIGRWDPCRCLG